MLGNVVGNYLEHTSRPRDAQSIKCNSFFTGRNYSKMKRKKKLGALYDPRCARIEKDEAAKQQYRCAMSDIVSTNCFLYSRASSRRCQREGTSNFCTGRLGNFEIPCEELCHLERAQLLRMVQSVAI